MKTPGRNMMIGYDLADPTLWEEEYKDGTMIGKCAACGKEICYGDHDIRIINRLLLCGNCHDFKKMTPSEFFTLFDIDLDSYTGRELTEEIV